MREPLQAVQWIDRYLRYLGNLRQLGTNAKTPNVAVIIRGVDQIVPADGDGFEHGSTASLLRGWSCESPFTSLPLVTLLIADNLNDVEPHDRELHDRDAHPRAAARCRRARTRARHPARAVAQGLRRRCQSRADCRGARRRHRGKPRQPGEAPPLREQTARRSRSREAQEGAGRARFRGPGGIHRAQTHARGLSRPGSAQDLAAAGHRVVALGRPEGAADGLSTVRPGRHGQDLPGRMPGRRSRRARGQAQEFPRSLGGLERGQSREDLPPDPRARPLHGVHRRSGPDARQTRLGQRRQRPVRPHLFDDRAGDVGQRQSRPRVVAAGVVASRSHRSRPEAPRPRRRESAAAADQHGRRERTADRPPRQALRPRAQARRTREARTEDAHAC